MPRWLQFAIFFSIALSIYGGAHFYVYHRLAVMLGLSPGRALWALRLLFVLLALSFIAARLLMEVSLNPFVRALYWASALWMGFFVYLFLSCLVLNLISGVLLVIGVGTAATFGRWVCLAALSGSTILSFAAWREANGPWKIVDLNIPVKSDSTDLDGFTIVQISDIHAGVIVDEAHLERLVAAVNGLRPDLVVITGDLMDENADRLVDMSDPLKKLNPPFGVYACTGNHEYYAGADKVIRHAADIGIRFLQNETVTLPNGLILAGVNDPTAARMGGQSLPLESYLGDRGQSAPVVFLSHQPRLYEQAAALGVDLMLSGHTHNGQLWPFCYITQWIYPHVHGLYATGASRHYVTTGAGTWGPPMRLDAAPEIVHIRLKQKSAVGSRQK